MLFFAIVSNGDGVTIFNANNLAGDRLADGRQGKEETYKLDCQNFFHGNKNTRGKRPFPVNHRMDEM